VANSAGIGYAGIRWKNLATPLLKEQLLKNELLKTIQEERDQARTHLVSTS
jgi:hypothetical protein